MGPTMAGERMRGTIALRRRTVNRNNQAACLPHGGLNSAYKFTDAFLPLPSLVLAFSLPFKRHTSPIFLVYSFVMSMASMYDDSIYVRRFLVLARS